MLDRYNVGARFFDVTLDAIPDELGYGKDLRDWWEDYVSKAPYGDVEDRGRGVILYGNFGMGKTGAGVAVAKLFARYGAQFWFQEAISLGIAERDPLVRANLMGSGLLVIDDLGAKKNDDWGRYTEAFESVIRTRYNRFLPMVITTNLGKQDLCEAFPAQAKLFYEVFDWIEVKGKDWRADKVKERKRRG